MRTIPEAEAAQYVKELQIYGYTRIKGFMSPEETGRLMGLVTRHF